MATTMTGLRVSGLTTGYRGRQVFQGLDLPALPAGSLVGVLGPNAVGKSTLLQALAGLRPTEGEIRLGDIKLSALRGVQRMRHVGYLPQALPQATSLVAYEAVASACRVARPELSREVVEALIESVFDRLSLRPLALKRLEAMSGGQRQMVGLAQVLVREPELLLLDEPTSALDLRWQLALIAAVRDTITRRGATCLMALHDINLALRHCDQVLLLGPSGLLAEGEPHAAITPEALRSAYDIHARIEYCSRGRPLVLTDGVAE